MWNQCQESFPNIVTKIEPDRRFNTNIAKLQIGVKNDMRRKGNRYFLIRGPMLTLKAYLVSLKVCVLTLKVYLVTLNVYLVALKVYLVALKVYLITLKV